MSAKHTPGPWAVEYRSGRAAAMYGHHVASYVYSRPGVADGRDSISEVRGADDDTARANARLIAAAPELYAALREAERALSYVLAGEDGGRWKIAGGSVREAARNIARAALRKAEGEAE